MRSIYTRICSVLNGNQLDCKLSEGPYKLHCLGTHIHIYILTYTFKAKATYVTQVASKLCS